MTNDYYHNIVSKQQVAELQAQADQDRLAKEVRNLRRKARAEARAAAQLRAAVEGPVRRGPIAALRAWLGLSGSQLTEPPTAGRAEPELPVDEPAGAEPAQPHPAATGS